MFDLEKGLSIDIGTDLIKIVSYKKTKKVFTVLKAVTLKMPDCDINSGHVGDIATLAATISEAIKKNKLKGKNVDFTLSSNKIITREVSYPDLANNKLEPLIKMNSDEYFPVNLSEYTMDFEILEHYTENLEKMVRTNTVVIPTEIVQCYVQLANILKLKLVNISYVENAMMNYALLVDEPKPYMVVDFGSERSSVAIVSNRKIVLNRTLGNGVNKILDLVKQKYDADFDRAIEIASENNFIKEFSKTEDAFTIKITSNINLIINGIARLLDYYSSKNELPIENIYLTGIGANISGLDKYIAKYFSIDTKLLDDIKIIHSKDPNYLGRKNIYANAIGSVYSKINLIPESFIKNKKAKGKNTIAIELLVLLLFLSAAMLYFPLKKNVELEKRKDDLEAKLIEYKEIEPILAQRDELKSHASFLEEIDRDYSSEDHIVDILEQMEKTVPSDINYQIMGIDKDRIAISCEVSDKNVAVKYLEEMKSLKLDADPIFSDVIIASINADDDEDGKTGKYRFTIICVYNKELEYGQE